MRQPICHSGTDSTGLHRQSELTVKEPFRISYSEKNGKKVLDVVGLGESFVPAEEDEEEERLV